MWEKFPLSWNSSYGGNDVFDVIKLRVQEAGGMAE